MIVISKARAAISHINNAALPKAIVQHSSLHSLIFRMGIDSQVGNLLAAKIKDPTGQASDLPVRSDAVLRDRKSVV